MSTQPRLVARATASLVLTLVLGLLATGCESGNDTVVRFAGPSHGSIDRATLDHWMRAIVGADIQHDLGAEGPVGLASEPADYPRCVAAAKLVGPRSFFNQLRFDHAEAIQKCRELHEAIKAQALSFLIAAHWTMAVAGERNVTANASEVRGAFVKVRASHYPTEARLHSYLEERQWSLADLLFQVKLDLLSERLQTSSDSSAPKEASVDTTPALAGNPASVGLDAQQLQTLANKTDCAVGYVVPGCSRYRGASTSASPPNSLIERLTGKRPQETTGPR